MGKLYKKISPWIVKAGMAIYLIVPGGSIVLLTLYFVFPDLFRAEVKKLWEKSKIVLRKIGIIKS